MTGYTLLWKCSKCKHKKNPCYLLMPVKEGDVPPKCPAGRPHWAEWIPAKQTTLEEVLKDEGLHL